MPVENSNTALPTTVGVELEMENLRNVNSDIRYITGKLSTAGFNWVVKSDGSCGRGGAGVELNSPILRTSDDLDTVSNVCSMMSDLSYRVTPRCGLHVHVDVRNLTVDQRSRLIRFFVQYQECFFELAPGRRTNRFCKPLTPPILERLAGGAGWEAWEDRYFWMNGLAFAEHGTVEFRLMSGSLNQMHVVGWTQFLLHTYQKVLDGAFSDATYYIPDRLEGRALFDKMIHTVGIDGEVTGTAKVAKTWILARWDDAHSDLFSIRAERLRRLHRAWLGVEPYVKIAAPASVGATL